jgi:hypothetical protein
MDDRIERRATTLAAVAGLVVTLDGLNGYLFAFGPTTWQVALVVGSLAGLVSCLALATLALAPVGLLRWRLPARETFLFWAVSAFVAGLILIAANTAASAVELLGRGPSFE